MKHVPVLIIIDDINVFIPLPLNKCKTENRIKNMRKKRMLRFSLNFMPLSIVYPIVDIMNNSVILPSLKKYSKDVNTIRNDSKIYVNFLDAIDSSVVIYT